MFLPESGFASWWPGPRDHVLNCPASLPLCHCLSTLPGPPLCPPLLLPHLLRDLGQIKTFPCLGFLLCETGIMIMWENIVIAVCNCRKELDRSLTLEYLKGFFYILKLECQLFRKVISVHVKIIVLLCKLDAGRIKNLSILTKD